MALKAWGRVTLLCCLFVTSQGGCKLPSGWGGQWFQLGSGKTSLFINGTNIESKGECVQSDGDKFVMYDRTEKCYRCIVMHNKHNNVLQYKETYCMSDDDLPTLCNEINGDATLLSMFRVDAQGVPCPFKSPPFSVVYSKGHGDCGAPPSRAEPCTDDTRLVFRFQACPDIPGTEAAVEELECLATWREGTFHYLVGRLHHKMAMIDEERYRCFVYHKQDHTYQVAQSGEATCSGLLTPYEGSRNMKLTKIEGQHTRCKFPTWVTQHYHWRSLDYSHSFHFSHRNASLKISTRTGDTETKLMCHYVETEKPNMARIVVHVISGCDGGYKCMTLHKRDSHVIQMQQSEVHNDPADACRSASYESSSSAKTITMISGSLPTVKCPMEGRYLGVKAEREREKEREEGDCSQAQQSLRIACPPSQDTIAFESLCALPSKSAFLCHGSWRENSSTYIVGTPVSRHSTDARHYCFIISQATGGGGLSLQRLADTCALPAQSDWTFNITEIGKCSETSGCKRLRVEGMLTAILLFAGMYHAYALR